MDLTRERREELLNKPVHEFADNTNSFAFIEFGNGQPIYNNFTSEVDPLERLARVQVEHIIKAEFLTAEEIDYILNDIEIMNRVYEDKMIEHEKRFG